MELLAPGGDLDSIKAAIIAGADAVYCGLNNFNARNRAANLSFDELNGVVTLAHKHNCQVFLTLNIIILETEIPPLFRLLNKLVNTSIDGVIVQDMGLFYLLSTYFKTLDVHASTQVTTHNTGQIQFLQKLGVSRVNLSRELNRDEVTSLTGVAHDHGLLSEVFVHGSYCIGFSGLCYMSSAYGGYSGNRGRCRQPCRDQYQTTAMGNEYPLNLKDNSAFSDLQMLAEAGVDALKIEGRMKGAVYVFTVVNSWRKQLHRYEEGRPLLENDDALYEVFNRDFSNGWLHGDIHKEMFIDNPRDNTLAHIEHTYAGADDDEIEQAKDALLHKRATMEESLQDRMKILSIAKMPIKIGVSGTENRPLTVTISAGEKQFVVHSESVLRKTDQSTIDFTALQKRFKSLNNGQYVLENLVVDDLESSLCIPFKELTGIRNRIAFLLNGSIELQRPVAVPSFHTQRLSVDEARLSVVIGSPKDLHLCQFPSVDVYYGLPEGFKNECASFVELFSQNEQLKPWFPPVLIGEDYGAAVEFLKQVQPELLVTNNTGIAYEACEQGIPWIAGPCLNITNSFSLLSMSETFHCYGSFVSSEINKNQIKSIRRRENSKLYYSLYHPLLLMISRQCLFQQTVGCQHTVIDEQCIQRCCKSTSITNEKGDTFIIDKQKGGYSRIYSDRHFLNTQILRDLPGFFDGFFIDLRHRLSDGVVEDTAILTELFQSALSGNEDVLQHLNEVINKSTNSQYTKGV